MLIKDVFSFVICFCKGGNYGYGLFLWEIKYVGVLLVIIVFYECVVYSGSLVWWFYNIKIVSVSSMRLIGRMKNLL